MQLILKVLNLMLKRMQNDNEFNLILGIETAAPTEFQPLVALLMEQITRGKVKTKNWNKRSIVVIFIFKSFFFFTETSCQCKTCQLFINNT